MRKTAVVTGGSGGIGLEVSRQLVAAGSEVVVLARDAARGAAAVAGIGAGARLVVGDLSDTASTRAAAAAVTATCPRVDVLVHNAGIWPARCELNADGVERAFAVNHLAPFLLNHLLADVLGTGSRVVQVSAGLYVKGTVDLERTAVGADFHPIRTYADTKLANLALLPLFARAWEDAGVTIDAVHPGVIRTRLGDRRGPLGFAMRQVKRLWSTPAEGARPVVALALDATGTGRYLEIRTEKPVTGQAADPDVAARLWDQAARLTGVAVPGSG